MLKYKIGATVCLLVQISLIVWGIVILQQELIAESVKVTWMILIPFNAIMGIINIKTILK